MSVPRDPEPPVADTVDVAEQPERLTMVVWDGDVENLNAYLAAVDDPNGTPWVVENMDGSAFIQAPGGPKLLQPGALVHAKPYMWGGPIVTVYPPEEANARLYPYPEYPDVADESLPHYT